MRLEKPGLTQKDSKMSIITFKQNGNFKKTQLFFDRVKRFRYMSQLDKYGQMGVDALSANTPVDSGMTAASWRYSIDRIGQGFRIYWSNDNINDGVNIAIILQYGHGTGTGGWVEGIDYINPAIRPIFNEIAENAWKEVTQ